MIRFVRVKRWRWHKIVDESIAKLRYCDRVQLARVQRLREQKHDRWMAEYNAKVKEAYESLKRSH